MYVFAIFNLKKDTHLSLSINKINNQKVETIF